MYKIWNKDYIFTSCNRFFSSMCSLKPTWFNVLQLQLSRSLSPQTLQLERWIDQPVKTLVWIVKLHPVECEVGESCKNLDLRTLKICSIIRVLWDCEEEMWKPSGFGSSVILSYHLPSARSFCPPLGRTSCCTAGFAISRCPSISHLHSCTHLHHSRCALVFARILTRVLV